MDEGGRVTRPVPTSRLLCQPPRGEVVTAYEAFTQSYQGRPSSVPTSSLRSPQIVFSLIGLKGWHRSAQPLKGSIYASYPVTTSSDGGRHRLAQRDSRFSKTGIYLPYPVTTYLMEGRHSASQQLEQGPNPGPKE